MAIQKTGMRLTVGEQMSRRPEFRGRPLALEVKDTVSGRILRASEVVAAGAQGIGGVLAAAANRVLAVIKPEMVTSARLSFNVMKAPVTVAMFKQFVEDEAIKPEGYRITGHNADKLTMLLTDSKKGDLALTYVSYEDAKAFVAWRKEITGQDLRIPTEQEWEDAKREVGDQLTGNLWEWTQTIYSGISRVLRSVVGGYRSNDNNNPVRRYNDSTVRLVQDNK